ncbi:class I SAM-dependent methyltransferase [Streptosporangium sp. NPDC049078]|uniref:class I SAM-dependent methyltransferase n=1 Tax=Streptosporangium sp. NPDC049078 TaxID=3155767 RepID=UPI003431B35D
MTAAPLTFGDVWTAARGHCTRGCFGYHSTWRLFRQAGLKGNPRWHEDFYRKALTGRRPKRALVCGSSDETMPRLLTELLPDARIVVTDICRTPLTLVNAWADWCGRNVTTMWAKAPELANVSGPFDMIITDGLLSLLPTPDDWDTALARLANLLTDDGMLLYTTRIAGPAGRLEYDLPGRAVQALATAAGWPGPPGERLRLARQRLRGSSRPAPFTTSTQLRDTFYTEFAQVLLSTHAAAPTLALALHPAFWAGRGSICVGVAATHPRSRL